MDRFYALIRWTGNLMCYDIFITDRVFSLGYKNVSCTTWAHFTSRKVTPYIYFLPDLAILRNNVYLVT